VGGPGDGGEGREGQLSEGAQVRREEGTIQGGESEGKELMQVGE
jgi:hypothetical protein